MSNPVFHNLCYLCNEKLKAIGTSQPCAICFIKKQCQTYECNDVVHGDGRFCVKCKRIRYLCDEIKSLKETVKYYQCEEEERNKNKMEIIDE